MVLLCLRMQLRVEAMLQKMMVEIQRLKEYAVDVSDVHLQPLKGISYRARMAARLMRSFL